MLPKCFSNHRVFKKNNLFLIHINIPEDCVYELSYIIVQYEPNVSIQILSENIPNQIKQNMLKYYNNNIDEFIERIETNLDTFLSGGLPIDTKLNQNVQSKQTVKIEKNITIKLPETYNFPVNKLSFNNLNMEIKKKNILFLTCKSPNFEMQCKRCKTNRNVFVSDICECGFELKLNYIPVIDSEYLGSIFPDHCTFICLNPSKFQFNCEKCNSNYESNRVGLNDKFVMNCWECDTQLSFSIKRLVYIEKKTQVFKKGEELPNKGTCKHYKKSYRWFRFPCCGSVYPCDICHDLETNHESKLANKMICGLCSKEQSVKKDCDCGMSLKRTTNCWEGGKGNRNKLSMNKKDKKKYTK